MATNLLSSLEEMVIRTNLLKIQNIAYENSKLKLIFKNEN
jgi:hypothetical protein